MTEIFISGTEVLLKCQNDGTNDGGLTCMQYM